MNKFALLYEFLSVPSCERKFYLVGLGDGVIISAVIFLIYVIVF